MLNEYANLETIELCEKHFERMADAVNFEQYPCEQFDQETRNYAASSLVDALIASCESQEERIELSINLLGYDPR